MNKIIPNYLLLKENLFFDLLYSDDSISVTNIILRNMKLIFIYNLYAFRVQKIPRYLHSAYKYYKSI